MKIFVDGNSVFLKETEIFFVGVFRGKGGRERCEVTCFSE